MAAKMYERSIGWNLDRILCVKHYLCNNIGFISIYECDFLVWWYETERGETFCDDMKDDEEGSGLGVSIFFFSMYMCALCKKWQRKCMRGGVSVGIWIVYCVSSTIYVYNISM